MKREELTMFLASKELLHSKGRFVMIGLIIVLVSWLVFILSGLGNGLSDLAAGTLRQSEATAVVVEKGSEMSLSKSMISASVIDEVKEQQNITDAAAIGTASTSVWKEGESKDEKKTDVILVGVAPGSFMEPNPIKGEGLTINQDNQVIADDSLQNDGFVIGDQLSLNGSKETMTIAGFTNHQTLNHQPAVFTTLPKFRAVKYAAPDSDNGINDVVNGILVKGSNIDTDKLAGAASGLEAGTKKEAVNAVPGYTAENGTIMLMLWFLMVISAFVLGVFFYVLTNQKIQQFGVLKAIGGSNGFVIHSVMSQVFILSLISILAGILLTYITTLFLPDTMPFHLQPLMVGVYSIILLLISLISSLFSVVKIAKIDPLTALGRVE